MFTFFLQAKYDMSRCEWFWSGCVDKLKLTRPLCFREDVAGMLKILEQTVTEFGRAPMFSDIFRVLICKEDADRLQTGTIS